MVEKVPPGLEDGDPEEDLGVTQEQLKQMDQVLLELLEVDPTLTPDDLTPEMLAAVMAFEPAPELISIDLGAKVDSEHGEEEKKSAKSISDDGEQKSNFEIIEGHEREINRARGVAECTRAAADVLKARDVVDELTMSIASIEQQFADIDAKFMKSLTFLLGGGFKEPEAYARQPQRVSAEEASLQMLPCKRFTFLTGEGLSAPSGLPPVRSDQSFWKSKKKYFGEDDPRQILTRRLFDSSEHATMAVWEWHYDYLKLMEDKAANDSHRALTQFLEFTLPRKSVSSMLVSQSFDDFHCQDVRGSQVLSQAKDVLSRLQNVNHEQFTPHVYELHGNIRYMHCSNEEEDHSRFLVRGPSLQEFEKAYAEAQQKQFENELGVTQNFCLVPRCADCGLPMKPHTMFFDEAYSEHYYRKQTVMDFVQESDCLIVIGSALETNLTKEIVANFLDKDLPIIELNSQCHIDRGHNLQVLAPVESTIPVLFANYYGLKRDQESNEAAQSREETPGE